MKYLIKFVDKREYADDLMNGMLFSNSLYYYTCAYCPKKIRDRSEGTLTFHAMIKTSDVYHYSYSFFESETNDLHRKNFRIMIKKYHPKYAVVIKKDEFVQRLQTIQKFIKDSGYVNYCSEKTIDYSKMGFNKHFSFEYFHEFRILFNNRYKPRLFRRNAYGLHGMQEYKYKPSRDGLRFQIKSISDIAKVIKL